MAFSLRAGFEMERSVGKQREEQSKTGAGCVSIDIWREQATFCRCRSCFRWATVKNGVWQPDVCLMDTMTIYRSRHADLMRKIKSDIKNKEHETDEEDEDLLQLHDQLNHERNHQRNMSPFLRYESGRDPLDPDSVICVFGV